jgi:hypothetical protein
MVALDTLAAVLPQSATFEYCSTDVSRSTGSPGGRNKPLDEEESRHTCHSLGVNFRR